MWTEGREMLNDEERVDGSKQETKEGHNDDSKMEMGKDAFLQLTYR